MAVLKEYLHGKIHKVAKSGHATLGSYPGLNFIPHILYNRHRKEKTPGDSCYAMMMSGKGKIRKFTPSQRLPPDRKSVQSHIQRANFVVNCIANCLDGTYRQPNPLDYGWTLDDGVLQALWYTGAALPNDNEIIQLIEGSK